jgi:hypothetical protein
MFLFCCELFWKGLTVLSTGWSGIECGATVLSGIFNLINKINKTVDTTKSGAFYCRYFYRPRKISIRIAFSNMK